MEETLRKWGLCEIIDSSELQVMGGAAASDSIFTKIFEKFRNLVDFLSDYIPKLLEGFKDGLLGKSLAK